MTDPTQPAAAPAPARPQPTGTDAAKAAKILGEAIAQVQRVIVGQEAHGRAADGGPAGQGALPAGRCARRGEDACGTQFATVVGGQFARIQFTPDLVPSDIVGTRIYSARQEKFDIALDPVFVNFVLADEINRAPAKVQSAMLELMAEQQVSIGGTTYPVPQPFIVIATENPIESRASTRCPRRSGTASC